VLLKVIGGSEDVEFSVNVGVVVVVEGGEADVNCKALQRSLERLRAYLQQRATFPQKQQQKTEMGKNADHPAEERSTVSSDNPRKMITTKIWIANRNSTKQNAFILPIAPPQLVL
jgi:hypothetical protein